MSTDKQESIDVVELLYGIVKEEVDKLNEVSPQDPAIDMTTNPEGTNVWKELYDRYKATEGYKIDKEAEIGDKSGK